MSRAVVIFARAPEVEAAVKGLPNRFAALFDRNVAAWLRAAAAAGATPVISCAAFARFDAIAPEIERIYIAQSGATFGERLASTAEAAFALGFSEVLISGIDIAPNTAGVFEALASADAVVQPADDGGINLIALHAPERALLAAIRPRQRDVVERCRAYFASLIVLGSAPDIDSFAVGRSSFAEAVSWVELPRPYSRHITRPPPMA
jgi:glycosyltransferase A (GT-A) superfamily protein (DUF2064 family)